MKRISILIIGLLLILSCKKDKANNAPLVGIWKVTAMLSGPAMGGYGDWDYAPTGKGYTLILKSNGDYELTLPTYLSGTFTCSGKYRVINDSTLGIIFNCPGPNAEFNAPYIRSFNQLILNYMPFPLPRYKFARY